MYAVLIETSEEKRESWYYFIKYRGNEANLKHLYKQLDSIYWKLLPELCSFQLFTDILVSERTAVEMCQLKLNYLCHQKFDGKLKKIYFDFEENDGNVTKMGKVFDVLKYGRISQFFGEESSRSDGEEEEEEDEDYVEEEEEDSRVHTDYDSISESDSETGENAPSQEMLHQLKDLLV
jgi:hypothetical protein